jgi:outer membrane protein assembly factor BamB
MKRLLVLMLLSLIAGCGGGDGGTRAPPSATAPAAPPTWSPPAAPTAPPPSPLVAWDGIADWETFQSNPGHTGYVPVRLDPGRFSVRWRWDAPDTGLSSDRISAVVTGWNQVYAAVGTRLYARSEFDGSAAWHRDFGDPASPLTSPPATSAGSVYVVAGRGSATRLYAMAAGNGELRYAAPMETQSETYLAPTVAEDKVLAPGGRFGGLYAFYASSGQQAWFVPGTQTDQWTPAAAGSQVYVYTDSLSVLAAYDGTPKGKPIAGTAFPYTGAPVGSAPVIGAAGMVFALNGAARENALLAFDTIEQRLAWSVPGQYAGNPAYAGGRVFALARAPLRLEVRAEVDATLLWQWSPPLEDGIDAVGDVLLTDNLVFFSTSSAVFAIDLASRRAVWRLDQPGRLALSANGILYIAHGRGLTAVDVR